MIILCISFYCTSLILLYIIILISEPVIIIAEIKLLKLTNFIPTTSRYRMGPNLGPGLSLVGESDCLQYIASQALALQKSRGRLLKKGGTMW